MTMQKHEDFRREALDVVVTVFLSLPIAGVYILTRCGALLQGQSDNQLSQGFV